MDDKQRLQLNKMIKGMMSKMLLIAFERKNTVCLLGRYSDNVGYEKRLCSPSKK